MTTLGLSEGHPGGFVSWWDTHHVEHGYGHTYSTKKLRKRKRKRPVKVIPLPNSFALSKLNQRKSRKYSITIIYRKFLTFLRVLHLR